ncbi:alanine racemase [Peptacetobacter sp.]|uniref:alanine racemase n=1 Tax=Peptacetobacter sp. TaxID=2991975 RepID=UPI00260F731A|nr:alanine racemase [Peptacetobacter sp.]
MIDKNRIKAVAWAEIDLDAFKKNLKNIRNILTNNEAICGIVKADAYGHGAVEIARTLEENDVEYLAVSRAEEAMELRRKQVELPILILGYTPELRYKDIIRNDVMFTIYSKEDAEKLNKVAEELEMDAKVHIKIDTGMNRLGFKVTEESIKDIKEISKMSRIRIKGMFTHFAASDELDKTFTNNQGEKFKYITKRLKEEGVNIPLLHTANSAATVDCEDMRFDMVRAGIIMYGCYPSDEVMKERVPLEPVMTIKTKVSHVKVIEPGEKISYGCTYEAKEKEKIATLAIGYADGFVRGRKNPKVCIKGKYYDVVGRICMDQCMIKIGMEDDINVGDEVIVFGKGGVSISEFANDCDTISHEIMCNISRRIPRVFIEHEDIIKYDDYLRY